MIPKVASIAGSDPSGGAGIQADLKAFSALGAYGCAVLTALTAQSTRGVTGVHAVPAAFVEEQIRTLVADVPLDAVKIGMLATAELAETVGALIADVIDAPVVLDPVMIATSGDRLLSDDAMDAVRALVPLAALITPNLHEAAALLGEPVASDLGAARAQALALRELGAARVLVKGGHGAGGTSVDVFADADGVHELSARRIDTKNTHGTGCSLSSAIAALVPQRATWLEAVADAKTWLTGAIAAADQLQVGSGSGPVHHFHALWTDTPVIERNPA
ncbi:MAG: bifunctional hydroxymethylpyrimidine kinase/phosphomethylpyrimidine kinase [Propioniciclava sp.]|uniref:bifunctional hydroxymethylpyrimidine kinase/phosphomethylpyrimidine kinase n=1 Tax=Propioniciclava sp. TaxID=2038686 RepID=UPI0039E434C3